MFRSLLSSFARSFGRQLGRTAAYRLRWLAIPLLIVVCLLGLLDLASGGELSRVSLPIVPPSILGPALPKILGF
jgi:hypothetical protein